jgi:hypothetical protein
MGEAFLVLSLAIHTKATLLSPLPLWDYAGFQSLAIMWDSQEKFVKMI